MQRVLRATALLALATSALGSQDASSISAVQKVVHMLTDMAGKAKQEKKAEEVSYAGFAQWCGNEKANLQEQIKKAAIQMESLTTEIAKTDSDVKELAANIGTLQSELTKYEADLKVQKDQREKEHKAFLAEQQDYAESVDALDRAIAVLSKQSYDRSSLLQLTTDSQLPANAQQMVSAFLGMMGEDDGTADPMAYSAPEANAYEFQSGGVVEMLKRLQAEFNDKKGECEKEEMNSKHAFDMIEQDLSDSVEKGNEDLGSMTTSKLSKQEASAELKKQLQSTTTVKVEDSKTLGDTIIECKEKKLSFEEKQTLRAEEIQALAKAIEILGSEDVQANAAKHLSLAQVAKGSSLVRIRGAGAAVESAQAQGIRVRAREFLAQESTRLHSKQLELLAQRLETDPFGKVKKMISDMITKLMGEAHEDAEHEGFCDKEMGTNKISREKLSEGIDRLNAEVENGKATITQLVEDIATMSKDVASMDSARAQMTDMRTAEKAKNEQTVADAIAAQKAVVAATAVLKDFYEKAGSATAFVQTGTITVRRVEAPEWGASQGKEMGSEEWDAVGTDKQIDKGHKAGMQTFGEGYQGQQDEAGGVLAMLEVIGSDFSTLQADTESSEALAANSYKDFMAESSKDMAVKKRKIEMNGSDKISAESKLRDDTADLKFTQDKLLAAERYYDKLKPQCVDSGMSSEDRAQARQEEIQSLKEALTILSGEDIAV
jgi:septal ring factor EnvC (AmiA/AmiB activator)